MTFLIYIREKKLIHWNISLKEKNVLNVVDKNCEIINGIETYVVNGHTTGQQLIKISEILKRKSRFFLIIYENIFRTAWNIFFCDPHNVIRALGGYFLMIVLSEEHFALSLRLFEAAP